MKHLLIDNEGRRIEYSEDDALWLRTRSTIVECNVPHLMNNDRHEFYPLTEYTIYHPGTRSGRMITMMDVNARLAQRYPDRVSCSRCHAPIDECICEPTTIR